MAQRGQDQQHGRTALARSGAAGDHQPPRPQPPVHLMQLADLARPQPLLPGCGQPGQRREPCRGHRGRHRPGERGGWPFPAHRNGFWLQQPPLPGCPGPLRAHHPGQQVRQPREFLPGDSPAALAALVPPPYPADPARGNTRHRQREPHEAFQVRVARRPPHRHQSCHRHHRDDPSGGIRQQASSPPAHGLSLTANISIRPRHLFLMFAGRVSARGPLNGHLPACRRKTVTHLVTFAARWRGTFGAIWPVCLIRGRS